MTTRVSRMQLAMVLVCAMFLAVSDLPGLTLSQTHSNGVYDVGEQITFMVTDIPAAVSNVQYEILLNGSLVPVQSGDAAVSSGSVALSYVPTNPVCVVAEITAGSEDAALGAVAAPFEIEPSLPVIETFDTFWAAKKAKLAAIPMNIRMTSVSNAPGMKYGPEVESFDIKVDSLGERPVSGYYVRPVGASAGSLPAVINLHGAGIRSANLRAATVAAKDNKLSLDINAHGLTNGLPASYYSALASGELSGHQVMGLDDDPDSYYFRDMYMRVVRAIDFIALQPEWDGKTLRLQGGSQGGGQSLVGAGLDPRVTEIDISVPAFCDLTGSILNRQPGWPIWRRTITPEQLQTLRYYDATHFAARTRATSRVEIGLIDTTCSPAGKLAMFNRYRGEKTAIIIPERDHGNATRTTRQRKDPAYRWTFPAADAKPTGYTQ